MGVGGKNWLNQRKFVVLVQGPSTVTNYMCISYKRGTASALAIVKVVQCFILFLCPFPPLSEGEEVRKTNKEMSPQTALCGLNLYQG